MNSEEIEKFAAEEVDKVKNAVRALQEALIQGALTTEYQARTRPLDEEFEGLAVEDRRLRAALADLTPVVEAREKVCEQEALKLMAEGKKDKSAAKSEEGRSAGQPLQEMRDKIQNCQARMEVIMEEKLHVAHRVFGEVFPYIPEATHAVIEATVDLLDGIWAGILAYERDTNTGEGVYRLVRSYHKDQLAPTDFGQRALSQKVDSWFSPRR